MTPKTPLVCALPWLRGQLEPAGHLLMTCRPRTTAAAQREPREPRAMAVPPCETRELCVEGRAESPCNEGTSYSAVFLLLIDAQGLLRCPWKTHISCLHPMEGGMKAAMGC